MRMTHLLNRGKWVKGEVGGPAGDVVHTDYYAPWEQRKEVQCS